MTEEEIENKCAQALENSRALVRFRAPYVTKTLYGLIPHLVPGLDTLGVSRNMVLVVDPAWYIKLSTEEQGACLMHEISHILRDLDRLAQFPNKDRANQAFDIPINHSLREGGWKLPKTALYPETFGFPVGLTGEQYYDLLEKHSDEVEKKLEGTQAGLGAGKCGSCAGNAVDKALEEALDKSIGRTTADVDHIRHATAKDIQEAVAQGRGTIPGTLSEILPPDPDAPKNKISWRVKLSRILRRCTGRTIAGRADYSYKRLARSSFLTGTIKPGMVSHAPIIAFVEDTSGSMGHEQTREARQQAVDVMKQLGIESAWWISADAAVAAPPRIRRLKEIRELPIEGRGGTDFSPAIALAQTLRPRPDILIYLTDGDGAAPAEPPPRMEVVFCIVPSYHNQSPADWGHTVIIKDEVA